jgi:hypothetical protein
VPAVLGNKSSCAAGDEMVVTGLELRARILFFRAVEKIGARFEIELTISLKM